jgi:hypothetical protein
MIADGDDEQKNAPPAEVISFPFSRVAPPHSDAMQPVTYGAFAELFGIPREQTTGHWCSRCRIIWYGYLLEVACPNCGNRHG